MPDDVVTMPGYYKVLADALSPLIEEIKDAFIKRPVPDGSHRDNIIDMQPMFEDLAFIMRDISHIVSTIPGCMETKEDSVSNDAVIQTIARIKELIKKVIVFYHEIWEKSFPFEYSDGQILASAVLEDILRKCLKLFEKTIDIIETPPEEILQKYGSTTLALHLSFSSEAAECFNRWINTKTSEIKNKRNCIIQCRGDNESMLDFVGNIIFFALKFNIVLFGGLIGFGLLFVKPLLGALILLAVYLVGKKVKV